MRTLVTNDSPETKTPAPPQNTVVSGEILPPAKELVPAPQVLPVPVEALPRKRVNWKILVAIALAVIGGAGGGFYWWQAHRSLLPASIVWSNGRIEAQEIDIDTKFAERVLQLLVDEGDMVAPGQVVAIMDTRDMQASLHKAEAQMQEAQRSLDEARANVAQQKTEVTFNQQELDRTTALVKRGFATYELLDQRRQALNGSIDALNAANERVAEAEKTIDATRHDVELYKVNIADNTLVSPTIGRIQYRISNVGEVLPAGGKVFTMLDISDVYMDIYLPTVQAGLVRLDSDARIVLDAYPHYAIPAYVSFVATQAQFTPKAVETKSERDKLMFRVKVRVEKDFLRTHAQYVRTGLPGVAYVRTDPKISWPENLRGPGPR